MQRGTVYFVSQAFLSTKPQGSSTCKYKTHPIQFEQIGLIFFINLRKDSQGRVESCKNTPKINTQKHNHKKKQIQNTNTIKRRYVIVEYSKMKNTL